jgi:hypothetical protein
MVVREFDGTSSPTIDHMSVVHKLLHASGVNWALSLSPYAAAVDAGLANP